MLTLELIVFIALVLAAALFWWRSMGIRAMTMSQIKYRLVENDLQLLDQSLVLDKLRLRRGNSGAINFWRQYSFEFTSTGMSRYRGVVCVFGQEITSFELETHPIN